MFNITLSYYRGNGTTKNLTQAVVWYQRAAEQGDAEAMRHLARCYENGEGVEKDPAQASYWFSQCP